MAKGIEIGKHYRIMLNFLVNLYDAKKYETEKNLSDEKGRSFICYVCLNPINKEHFYFIISNKRLNMLTEIRIHKECIESLI